MVATKISTLLLLPAMVMAAASSSSTAGTFTMDKNGGDLVPKLPENSKDTDCVAAYKQPISCDIAVTMSINPKDKSHVPDEKSLDKICTKKCLSSLQTWIRGKGKCDSAKFLDFLGLSNSTTDGKYTDSDLQQFFISGIYWDKCLTELNTNQKYGASRYCISQTAEAYAGEKGTKVPTTFYTDDAENFCKASTCGAQAAYLWAPKKIITKVSGKKVKRDGGKSHAAAKGAKAAPAKAVEAPKGDLISLDEACPNIDTSRFPKREGGAAAKSAGNKTVSGGQTATTGAAGAATSGAKAGAKATTTGAHGANQTGAALASQNSAQQVSMVERSVAVSALLVAVAFTIW
ncbi:hypothetical protein TWF696_003763 [Orbilia brochopaga]|uniref:Uncharacterized protein n=1 Tax=Orbilia brochopaga TaxID=3140254 RepID=A0AAV9V439_9PEZI